MNVIVSLLIVISILILVKPAQADNNLLQGKIIPAFVQSSLKVPFLPIAFANGRVDIQATNGSNVTGEAELQEVPQNLDTHIKLKVSGLEPNGQYLPIYYKNSSCEREDDSINKSIQGAFFADANGEGSVEDTVKDSLNRIGSVSIRRADNFELIACGSL